jgi:hypothetical protein
MQFDTAPVTSPYRTVRQCSHPDRASQEEYRREGTLQKERGLERRMSLRRLANSSTHARERQVVLELLAEEVAKLKSVPQGHANESPKAAQ